MADYKEMYLKLFRSVTRAIALLEETQAETEEMFMSAKDPSLTLLPPPDRKE